MKRKISAGMLVGVSLLVAVTVFNISYVFIWNTFQNRLSTLNAREAAFIKLSEITAYINEFYVDDYSDELLLDGAARGYVNALPDETSYYITAEDMQWRQNPGETTYAGIGIAGYLDREHDGIFVLGMHEGSTAAEFGIECFDVITEVDGLTVAHLGYEAAMEALWGVEGTDVDVVVYRARTDERFSLTLRRGVVIPNQTIPYYMIGNKTGYINIQNFDIGMDTAFLSILAELKEQGIQSLIIDLRMNTGGQMDVMENIASALMGEGVVYYERNKGLEPRPVYSGGQALEIPIVALVNEHTIGAGEFLAAALRESGTAKLVGAKTPGFGYAQSNVQLSDGSAIVFSSTEYFTPQGNALHEIGLKPDHVVMMDIHQQYDCFILEKGQDLQLQAAIALLS